MLDLKNIQVPDRRLLSLAASLLLLAACSESTPDANEALFVRWDGTWQAAEPLFRDDAVDEVYQTIHELRPEYSVDELEALFIATADVEYTSLEAEWDTLTFFDGSQIVCSGQYTAGSDSEGDEGAASGPESYTDFVLAEETGGDCSSYGIVSLTDVLDPDNPDSHFHIVTGTTSGPLRPPPWNPSVWTSTTTADAFAELFLMSAPGIAGSLPAK